MAGRMDDEKSARSEESSGVKLSFGDRLRGSFTETPCISGCFGT